VLLGADRVRVLADRLLNALIGGAVVVLPDRDNASILGLLATHEPRSMTELNRQQVSAEKLVEDRQVLGNCRIDPHAIQHLVAACGPREVIVQLASDFVHPLLGDRRTIGQHHLEDPGATQLPRQVG
jgi:hypothetical protein